MALGTVVDTSVLVDILGDDPLWRPWSARALSQALGNGPVVINQLILAELSGNYERAEDVTENLPAFIERENLPWEAALLAGRIFVRYRQAGGTRRSPLPDFYIAAHAAVTGRALLTRDRPRHLDLLPRLEVIAPAGP